MTLPADAEGAGAVGLAAAAAAAVGAEHPFAGAVAGLDEGGLALLVLAAAVGARRAGRDGGGGGEGAEEDTAELHVGRLLTSAAYQADCQRVDDNDGIDKVKSRKT